MNPIKTIAFFDLDYTLLNASSGLFYVKEAIKQRRVPLWVAGYTGFRYKTGLIDFGQAHATLIKHVGRYGYDEATIFFEKLVAKQIMPHLTTAGKAKIEWHKKQGHRVVIISASIEEIVKPISHHLGLEEDYICTRLAIQNGRYIGELDGLLCYGSGKVALAKEWAAKNGFDFPQSVGYLYTDSSSDLPLLELANHPVAVNPSRKLAKIAIKRGWVIEKF